MVTVGSPSLRRVRALGFVVGLVLPVAAALGQSFDISTHRPNGKEIGRFVATLNDQHIDTVRIGPDGNIWITRADNSHQRNVPNPDDMVAVFDADGNELRTITGGGMRHPTSVAWDSDGNIYIAGEEIDFTTNMYKYDDKGAFIKKFRTAGWNLIDVYNDIAVTDDDRIYVTAWWGTGNADQMTEFNTGGQTMNTFSPTGPSYFHRPMALSPSNTLWVLTPKNGPGADLAREFNLAGNQIRSFSTSAAIPGSRLVGLETNRKGNLMTFDRSSNTLYELSPSGNIVDKTVISDVTNWVIDFTFALNGDILVANQSRTCRGKESLKLKCKSKRAGNRLRAVAKRGLPRVVVTFCLDENCQEKTLNKRGKAKATWDGVSSGPQVVTVSPCGLRGEVHCP